MKPLHRLRLALALIFTAIGGLLYSASLPLSAPVQSGLSQSQLLGYIADNTQRSVTGSGVATLPAAGPVHSGLSQGQLLGYIADNTQDLAARLAGNNVNIPGQINVGGGTAGLLSGNPGITVTRTITGTGASAHGLSDESYFYEGGYGYCTFDAMTRLGWWTGVTGTASTDTLTAVSTVPWRADDPVKFGWLVGGSGLSPGTTYYIRDISGSTFKVSATAGGAPIDFTTNITTAAGNPSWMQLVEDHCAGGQSRHLVSGYVAKAYGWNSQTEVAPGGKAAEVIHFYATDALENSASVGGVTYTGNVGTQYGMLIGAMTTGDANIAIASTSVARSYHNGRVTIGTNSYSGLENCAMLQINSTSASGDGLYRGVLLPKMTKAQRSAIPAPLRDGLAVYQTDNTPGLRVYTNGAWVRYGETADP